MMEIADTSGTTNNIHDVRCNKTANFIFSAIRKSNCNEGKVPLWGRSALQPYRLIVLTPKGVPSFNSRGAAHQAARAT
jgi:hypothetical protein